MGPVRYAGMVRRRFALPFGGLAAALVGVVLTSPVGVAHAAASEPPRDVQALGVQEVQAIQADSVVDGYGVCIHTNYLNTPYLDYRAVGRALTDLGVRHVRDDLYLAAPRQYAVIRSIADRGIGFDLILGRPNGGASAADYVRTVADELPASAVDSLEGANEWDLFSGGGDEWPAEVEAWQRELHAAIQANPATESMPLLAPALAFRWNYAKLGDLAPYADVANAHMYPGGFKPSNQIGQITSAVRSVFPHGPLVTTEAGYHNAVGAESSHPGVPEDVAGVYLPRMLLEHIGRGESRMYSYELIDEFPDLPGTDLPGADLTGPDPESHFGLLRHDLSPKPAYTAMRNLLGLLADPGPSFAPGSLPLTASGLPSDARYLLTEKRDGTFVLLLWRDVSIYDTSTEQEVAVVPDDVTLRLPSAVRWTSYRPSDQAEPVATTTASSLSLPLDGEVTAVRIGTAEVPTAPQAVTAEARRGKVAVSWRDPAAGAPYTSYRVTVGGHTVTVGPHRRHAVVKRLRAGQRVRAHVAAANVVGWGAESRSGRVRIGR